MNMNQILVAVEISFLLFSILGLFFFFVFFFFNKACYGFTMD